MRIVGLDTVGVFDAGKTVIFRALRVLEQFRGMGIAKLLSAFCMQYVREHYPTVERVRVSTLSTNHASIAIHIKQVGCRYHLPPCAAPASSFASSSPPQHGRCHRAAIKGRLALSYRLVLNAVLEAMRCGPSGPDFIETHSRQLCWAYYQLSHSAGLVCRGTAFARVVLWESCWASFRHRLLICLLCQHSKRNSSTSKNACNNANVWSWTHCNSCRVSPLYLHTTRCERLCGCFDAGAVASSAHPTPTIPLWPECNRRSYTMPWRITRPGMGVPALFPVICC